MRSFTSNRGSYVHADEPGFRQRLEGRAPKDSVLEITGRRVRCDWSSCARRQPDPSKATVSGAGPLVALAATDPDGDAIAALGGLGDPVAGTERQRVAAATGMLRATRGPGLPRHIALRGKNEGLIVIGRLEQAAFAHCGLFTLAVVGLFASGCATFSDLPGSAPRHPGEPPFEDLLVFVEKGYDPLEASGWWYPQPVKAEEEYAFSALRRSGWAREVSVATHRSRAHLELRVQRYNNLSTSSLSLVTLGLIPIRHASRLKVKLSTLEAGRTAETCVRITGYHRWVHLFLAPFMGRYSPGAYERRAVHRLVLQCGRELFVSRLS